MAEDAMKDNRALIAQKKKDKNFYWTICFYWKKVYHISTDST